MAPKKMSMKKNGDIHSLPKEMIFHILLQLSAQVLMIAKSVCRAWSEIVEDPFFVRAHLDRAKPRLLFQSWNLKYTSTMDFLTLDVSRGRRNRVAQLGSIKYDHILEGLNPLQINGSCDGLLLVENIVNHSFFVANFVTERCLELPTPSPTFTSPVEQYLFAFALDPSARKYKVVHLFLDVLGCIAGEILTVGSGSWRNVEWPGFFPDGFFRDVTPVIAGGFVHWLFGYTLNIPNDPMTHYLISMDLGDEQLRMTEFPDGAIGSCSMVEMAGSLSLLSCSQFKIDVWVLKDNDHNQIWSRRSTITLGVVVKTLHFNWWRNCFQPIATLDGGETIIFKDRHQLFSYDLKMHVFKEIKTHSKYLKKDARIFIFGRLYNHVATLVTWEI